MSYAHSIVRRSRARERARKVIGSRLRSYTQHTPHGRIPDVVVTTSSYAYAVDFSLAGKKLHVHKFTTVNYGSTEVCVRVTQPLY